MTVNWRKEPSDAGQDPQPPEPNKLRPAVVVQPSLTNGCKKVSYLLPQNLTCIAKTRITAATNSVISPAELQQLR